MTSDVDQNDLAYWFPRVAATGLPVPRTEIVKTDVALFSLLDGEMPDGLDEFVGELRQACRAVKSGPGQPVFLRTGHGSGKHDWLRTCCLLGIETEGVLESHITALVEWSALADFFGLPTETWVAREMIPTSPICRCQAYGMMPVVREFRFFASPDKVDHIQPYWPEGAVEEGVPDIVDWRPKLREISVLPLPERIVLAHMSRMAARAAGGYWSVDWLQDRDGVWWLCDMALGEESFRYESEV